jgi:dynein light intermediate chain 1
LYGASLIFTEIHQHNNLEILYKYILHRIYDQEFKDKVQPNQKNSIFIPSGFDSLQFIESLCKGTAIEEKIYEEVIVKPAPQ